MYCAHLVSVHNPSTSFEPALLCWLIGESCPSWNAGSVKVRSTHVNLYTSFSLDMNFVYSADASYSATLYSASAERKSSSLVSSTFHDS